MRADRRQGMNVEINHIKEDHQLHGINGEIGKHLCEDKVDFMINVINGDTWKHSTKSYVEEKRFSWSVLLINIALEVITKTIG